MRTFLAWLNFAVVVGGTGVWLLRREDGAGNEEDASRRRFGTGAGVACELLAIAMMVYALTTFLRRAEGIRHSEGRSYDLGMCIRALMSL